MRLSQVLGQRFKERPAGFALDSVALLVRGGYVRREASGDWTLLGPGTRVVRRFTTLLRSELEAVGGQEMRTAPSLLPAGDAAHTPAAALDAMASAFRREATGLHDVPALVYTELPPPRTGGYPPGLAGATLGMPDVQALVASASSQGLRRHYDLLMRAFARTLSRAGLDEVYVAQSTEGPDPSVAQHEVTAATDAGERRVAVCDTCTYRATIEAAVVRFDPVLEAPRPLEKVHTPGARTIAELAGFLDIHPERTAKAVFFAGSDGPPVMVLIRGDVEVNMTRLTQFLRRDPASADEASIRAAGAEPGFAGPVGLDPEQCRMLVDESVLRTPNLVTGANAKDYHLRNFNADRDAPGMTSVRLARVYEGAGCPVCNGTLSVRNATAVARLAWADGRLTETLELTINDAEGRPARAAVAAGVFRMGAAVTALVENRHDRFGPVWPPSVAPWDVHICVLDHSDDSVREAAEGLYGELAKAGVESLLDDRGARPGVQFADADLLGAPMRLVVSAKRVAEGLVECKARETGETSLVALSEAVQKASERVRRGPDLSARPR